MLVWVVDPQKYADSALHDGYLKPLAGHAALMVVALNQVDRLNPEQRRATMADLRRLLDSEGLAATRLVAVSALRGEGLGPLRELIADAARDKEITARRFAADIAREAALVGEALLGPGSYPVARGRVRVARQRRGGVRRARGHRGGVAGVAAPRHSCDRLAR